MRKGGRAYQLTAQIGEYLVAVELGRRGYISTTFTQNVPDFDILAIDRSLKRKIPLQVKTIHKGGGWQSTATQWMNIEFDGEYQKISGKTKISNPNLIYVLVELGQNYGEDKFYLLRKKQFQQLLYKSHKTWLEQHGGKRPRKPHSLHLGIDSSKLTKYKDNWEILEKKK